MLSETIIRDINDRGGLTRFGEVREISVAERTVELAFSSEEPCERWFGDEVLVHEVGAIRLDRLQSGAALLLNHDWDDQIGVVESVSIGSDRRGRAVVRFGRGAQADEIFRDVQDGIRRHVSVGYLVHKVEIEVRKGAADLVRVTDWEPYEISIVSVPADPTVGVGRDASRITGKARAMEDDEIQTQTPPANGTPPAQPPADPVRLRAQATEAERARTRSILEMGESYGLTDLARDFARDGKSVDEFKTAALAELNRQRGGRDLTDQRDSEIGMTDAEVGRFSIVRVIRAMANPESRALQEAAAFEFEASRAAADKMHRSAKGFVVPVEVLTRAIAPRDQRVMNSASSGATTGATGGYTIATDLLAMSFVEMLRARSVALRLATSFGGLVGNLEIPRQASGATGYWIGEDDDAPETGMEFDQIAMSPKTVAGRSEITRKLLNQSSLDVEALVRADLARAIALTTDRATFYGTGSANQPRGIANYVGINAVTFTTGGQPTYAQIVQMETEIATDNADVASMAHVLPATMRGYLKTKEKFAGTTGATIWEDGGTVNGYSAEVTNQVNNGDIFFGNWADILVGMWGGLEITVDPFTFSAKGRLRVVAMQDVDVALRRTASFCLGR